MEERITARDLMRPVFLRLGASHTLREAMGLLLESQSRHEGVRVLIALESDGTFSGLLSAKNLLQFLVSECISQAGEADNAKVFEECLLLSLPDLLNRKVSDAMVPVREAAEPDDGLVRLIERMREKRLECIPVMESGRVVGVVHLSDVFNAAASLALSSQSPNNQ